MNRALRIAVFHNSISGAKRATYEMSKELALRGHTLVEVAPSTAEMEWCSLAPYVASRHVFPLEWPVWRRRVPFLTPYLHMAANVLGVLQYHQRSKGMACWLEEQSFDVLFANDCSFMFNPPIAGHARIPTLLYIHHGSHLCFEWADTMQVGISPLERVKNIYFSPARMVWNSLRYASERWVARRAGAIACNSKLAQRMIQKAYGTNSKIIHYGVDTSVFTPDGGEGPSDYVLGVGSVIRRKSFGFLIESLSTIPISIRPPLLLAYIHSDPDEMVRLFSLARNCGVALKVVKPASDQELVHLYNGARVFVFAAQHEAFGQVVLESMACGTPVVGVEDGGYVDCILPNVTGFVTKRSPECFGEAITTLIESPAVRDQMSQSARQHVLEYWKWDRAVNELEQLLYTICQKNSLVTQKGVVAV